MKDDITTNFDDANPEDRSYDLSDLSATVASTLCPRAVGEGRVAELTALVREATALGIDVESVSGSGCKLAVMSTKHSWLNVAFVDRAAPPEEVIHFLHCAIGAVRDQNRQRGQGNAEPDDFEITVIDHDYPPHRGLETTAESV